MKRTIFLMGLLCLSVLCRSQTNQPAISFGHVDTIYSAVLKEKRPVLVYSPSFNTVYFSKPQYPVLYVLDGDGYFASLVTMVQQLSVHNGNTVLPEMIIVGIPNIRGARTRDLTPTASSMDAASGGGEAFTRFLEQDLIPYIDKNYATAPYRTIIGHSLGGLMVINTLLKHTALFNSYIALDPSMSYDDARLLKQAPMLLQHNQQGHNLFLGIANTMNPGMDTSLVRQDTAVLTYHIRSILKLKDDLGHASVNNLRWGYKYYPNDDHSSMALIAEYDALRFIFNDNRFPLNQPQSQYYDKNYSITQLKAMMQQYYQLVSKQMGYDVKPPEALMNQLGYTFLQEKDYERAKFFFETNINFYPNNFNVYDSMGDYYLTVGKKTEAVNYFKRALQLKSTAEIREKLKKLETK